MTAAVSEATSARWPEEMATAPLLHVWVSVWEFPKIRRPHYGPQMVGLFSKGRTTKNPKIYRNSHIMQVLAPLAPRLLANSPASRRMPGAAGAWLRSKAVVGSGVLEIQAAAQEQISPEADALEAAISTDLSAAEPQEVASAALAT